jgi:SAM-dependent methyltransferase
MDDELVASRWDDEYRRGRYADEPPLPFVAKIDAALKTRPLVRAADGLYVGCGNGRNFLPLVEAGLRLYGLDVSTEALARLRERRPALGPRLIHADFLTFRPVGPFGYVIALQVFQHGDGKDAARYFARVAELLPRGGLFFLRVNSASTEISRAHTVRERSGAGGLTIRYDEGPKRGLLVHFYSREELTQLAADAFAPIDEPREDVIPRVPPEVGAWAQWEMTWERR